MRAVGWTGADPGEALRAAMRREGWELEPATPDEARLWLVRDADEERDALLRGGPHGVVVRLPTSAAVLALRLQQWQRPKQPQLLHLDELTGLPGRRFLFAQLPAWRQSVPADWTAAVVMLDLDHFKTVNDRHGHAVGDAVLVAAAQAMGAALGPEDLLVRMGGEEFAVALARPRREMVRDDADAARAAIARQRIPQAASLQVRASAGLTWMGRDEELQHVLPRADAALYAAKAQGRDRLVVAGDQPVEDEYDDELQRFLDLTQVYTDRLTQMVQLRSRRLVERTRQDALQDRLTGAHNRRYFDQRLSRECEQARRHGLPLSMIFLDLDDFGQVNRRHGYAAGDAALRHVVDTVRPLARLTDWLARWGGEEFCLVLPGTPVDEAAEIAARVHAAVRSTPFELPGGGRLDLTCSLGVAGGHGEDGLTERASAAARRAKAEGKDRVVVDRG